MEAYLNRIDGIDDGIITMYLSKRNLTREKELSIRRLVMENTANTPGRVFALEDPQAIRPIGAFVSMPPKLEESFTTMLKIGREHITLLRFIDLSFSVYGMHRAGQDDIDAHSYRMQNRVIRASTRLGVFKTGEMSDFYQEKVVPTDLALAALGIDMPEELSYNGNVYVRATNGYILKGHENDKDYKRGLYMLSIPSDFVFRMDLADFAHFYKMRRNSGTANPEVKKCVESLVDQVCAATMDYVDRAYLDSIPI